MRGYVTRKRSRAATTPSQHGISTGMVVLRDALGPSLQQGAQKGSLHEEALAHVARQRYELCNYLKNFNCNLIHCCGQIEGLAAFACKSYLLLFSPVFTGFLPVFTMLLDGDQANTVFLKGPRSVSLYYLLM